MIGNTSWQVVLASILAAIGAIVDIVAQTPIIADSKIGQQVTTIGTVILGIATTFGFYHAKGKSVTTNPNTGDNVKANP